MREWWKGEKRNKCCGALQFLFLLFNGTARQLTTRTGSLRWQHRAFFLSSLNIQWHPLRNNVCLLGIVYVADYISSLDQTFMRNELKVQKYVKNHLTLRLKVHPAPWACLSIWPFQQLYHTPGHKSIPSRRLVVHTMDPFQKVEPLEEPWPNHYTHQ